LTQWGAHIVGESVPSLDEIFVAHAGTTMASTEEA
jgi:hypothetical protein